MTRDIQPKRKSRGQSLVELALTLPFVIILLFGFVEFSRAWQAWHGAKLAADDGCYTAAMMENAAQGQAVMSERAQQAKLNNAVGTVQAINQSGIDIGYECQITARHFPLFSNISVNLPGAGQVSLFSEGIEISYSDDYFRSVF